MRRYLEIEHLFKLTLAVYRVTAIFPIGEELGQKIRKLADEILVASLSNKSNGNVSRNSGEILRLFDEAEAKNWVDSRNFLVLKREYSKNYGKTVENPSAVRLEPGSKRNRQEKILEVVNGNGKMKIGELVQLFPEINRRTVLRDLEKLCRAGTVARNGNGRGVYYTKNRQKCDIMS